MGSELSLHSVTEDFIDVDTAARLLGLHPETIRRLVRRQEIPAFKAGRQWRFATDRLRQWAEARHAATATRSVLVVDDEVEIRNVIQLMLEDVGYEVRTAADAPEAIRRLDERVPGAIILDLRLPGESGVKVLQNVRQRGLALPVIVITGYPDSDLLRDALAYSPFIVLTKPVSPEKLQSTVALALGQKQETAVVGAATAHSQG